MEDPTIFEPLFEMVASQIFLSSKKEPIAIQILRSNQDDV